MLRLQFSTAELAQIEKRARHAQAVLGQMADSGRQESDRLAAGWFRQIRAAGRIRRVRDVRRPRVVAIVRPREHRPVARRVSSSSTTSSADPPDPEPDPDDGPEEPDDESTPDEYLQRLRSRVRQKRLWEPPSAQLGLFDEPKHVSHILRRYFEQLGAPA